MKRQHKKKPAMLREIASRRITGLFEQAENMFRIDSSLSDRYIDIARKIAMKYKVKIPRELKRRFCKHCHSFLMPGANCRVRITQAKVVYYCITCRRHMRFPLSNNNKRT